MSTSDLILRLLDDDNDGDNEYDFKSFLDYLNNNNNNDNNNNFMHSNPRIKVNATDTDVNLPNCDLHKINIVSRSHML